jgi:hypothetical protein
MTDSKRSGDSSLRSNLRGIDPKRFKNCREVRLLRSCFAGSSHPYNPKLELRKKRRSGCRGKMPRYLPLITFMRVILLTVDTFFRPAYFTPAPT